ncbi:CAP domain-containing protein [Ruminococcus intestinalis]|uniref:CAP domain-containing protein n=1 Tax=Ruminococcus intestinalis TaxID=2763066 RepID=UPI003F7E49C8
MKYNKLLKGITASALALTVPMSMLAMGGLAVSAASTDENVGEGTKIYFDIDSTGWENYTTIYCHIWRADGTGEWTNWQTRKEICTKEDNGLYSYDVAKTGNADEIVQSGDHNYYCVIFSADTGMQTYNTIMNGNCLGDTCYVTGNLLENPADSWKTCTEAAWKNHPECGPAKAITTTSKVIGSALPDGVTDADLLAEYLCVYFYEEVDPQETGNLAKILNVKKNDLIDSVKVNINKQKADYLNNDEAEKKLNTILDVINTAYKDISDSDEYDINLDGKFDVQDVTYLQLGISGKDQFTDTQKEIADYNNDGKIDVQDVTKAQIIISEVTVPVKPNPTPDPDPEPDPEPEPEPEPEPTTSYNREFADRVIELVNIERAKEGLKPLKKDDTLNGLSDIRAKETVTLFDHKRPNGTKWSTILKENNVSYTNAAENIASGYSTPEDVVNAWMNSEGHRASIMSKTYEKIGVSCYIDNNSKYKYYWDQLFIKD